MVAEMTGRMYHEGWAKRSALRHLLGLTDLLSAVPSWVTRMPAARYHVISEEFQVLKVLSTAGASVLALAT